MPKMCHFLMSMPGNIRSALSFKETNKQKQHSKDGTKDFVAVNLKILSIFNIHQTSGTMKIQYEMKQAGEKRQNGREKAQ